MMGARITQAELAAEFDPHATGPSIADLANDRTARRAVNRRQKKSRAARVERGERQVAVWLTPEALEAIEKLGGGATVAINRALVDAATRAAYSRTVGKLVAGARLDVVHDDFSTVIYRLDIDPSAT